MTNNFQRRPLRLCVSTMMNHALIHPPLVTVPVVSKQIVDEEKRNLLGEDHHDPGGVRLLDEQKESSLMVKDDVRCSRRAGDYELNMLSLIELEPTPIGPSGVRRIVDFVPMTESLLFHAGAEDIIDVLVPTVSLPYYQDEGTPITSSSRKRPAKSLSGSASDGLLRRLHRRTLVESRGDDRPKQRSSWTAPRSRSMLHDDEPSNELRFMFHVDFDEDINMDEEEGEDGEDHDAATMNRFRCYQSEHWIERFADLVKFRKEHGHCFVPHNFQPNPALSQWVKRQRYQFKLKQEMKHSTLTDDREALLETMGFVWDSHRVIWEERYRALQNFHAMNGHSNVPSNYGDKVLAIWVKCQRRQYKLFKQGKRSAMCDERIKKLDGLGFDWTPRRGVSCVVF